MIIIAWWNTGSQVGLPGLWWGLQFVNWAHPKIKPSCFVLDKFTCAGLCALPEVMSETLVMYKQLNWELRIKRIKNDYIYIYIFVVATVATPNNTQISSSLSVWSSTVRVTQRPDAWVSHWWQEVILVSRVKRGFSHVIPAQCVEWTQVKQVTHWSLEWASSWFSLRTAVNRVCFSVAEHYISLPGSNNGFPEMCVLQKWLCFTVCSQSVSECPSSMLFELCRAWNSNITEEHASPTHS